MAKKTDNKGAQPAKGAAPKSPKKEPEKATQKASDKKAAGKPSHKADAAVQPTQSEKSKPKAETRKKGTPVREM